MCADAVQRPPLAPAADGGGSVGARAVPVVNAIDASGTMRLAPVVAVGALREKRALVPVLLAELRTPWLGRWQREEGAARRGWDGWHDAEWVTNAVQLIPALVAADRAVLVGARTVLVIYAISAVGTVRAAPVVTGGALHEKRALVSVPLAELLVPCQRERGTGPGSSGRGGRDGGGGGRRSRGSRRCKWVADTVQCLPALAATDRIVLVGARTVEIIYAIGAARTMRAAPDVAVGFLRKERAPLTILLAEFIVSGQCERGACPQGNWRRGGGWGRSNRRWGGGGKWVADAVQCMLVLAATDRNVLVGARTIPVIYAVGAAGTVRTAPVVAIGAFGKERAPTPILFTQFFAAG